MKLLIFAIAIMLSIGFMGCTGKETTTDTEDDKEGTDTGTTDGDTDTGTTDGNGDTGDVDTGTSDGDVDTGTTDGNGDTGDVDTGTSDGDVDTGDTGGQVEEKDFWDYFDSNVGYKVDYTITSTGAGVDTTLTMTMYVYGENSRTDTSAEGMEARTYIVDNEMYVCSQTGDAWMCLSMGPTPATSADELEANQATYAPISMPDKTIAGVTGHCYKLEDVEGYDMEYCFSDDGAILWTKTSGEGITTEMTATSYSTAVTDADFVLPAEVTEIPSYG